MQVKYYVPYKHILYYVKCRKRISYDGPVGANDPPRSSLRSLTCIIVRRLVKASYPLQSQFPQNMTGIPTIHIWYICTSIYTYLSQPTYARIDRYRSSYQAQTDHTIGCWGPCDMVMWSECLNGCIYVSMYVWGNERTNKSNNALMAFADCPVHICLHTAYVYTYVYAPFFEWAPKQRELAGYSLSITVFFCFLAFLAVLAAARNIATTQLSNGAAVG